MEEIHLAPHCDPQYYYMNMYCIYDNNTLYCQIYDDVEISISSWALALFNSGGVPSCTHPPDVLTPSSMFPAVLPRPYTQTSFSVPNQPCNFYLRPTFFDTLLTFVVGDVPCLLPCMLSICQVIHPSVCKFSSLKWNCIRLFVQLHSGSSATHTQWHSGEHFYCLLYCTLHFV